MLPTNASLLLSLNDISNYVEKKYNNCLAFPSPGIYKHGDIFPTLINGHQYFVLNDKDKTYTKKVLEDINKLIDGDYVVDHKGNILLTVRDIQNKYTYLSDSPTVPTVGFDVIKLLIEYYITNKNTYTNESRNIKHSLIRKISARDKESIFEELLSDQYIKTLFNNIDQFIGRDIYHVYFLKRVSISDLLIEKTIDWRAYQWELQLANKQEDGNNTY